MLGPPFTRCFCICIVRKGGVRKGGTVWVSPLKKPAAPSTLHPAPLASILALLSAGAGGGPNFCEPRLGRGLEQVTSLGPYLA